MGFIILSAARIWSLHREPVKVRSSKLDLAKLCIAPSLCITLLVHLLAVLIEEDTGLFEIASLFVAVVASATLVWLSAADHRFSVKPSDLSVLYLLVTIGEDIFKLTYPTVAGDRINNFQYTKVTLAELLSRLVILFIECQSKAEILVDRYRNLSPEETAGVLSTSLFWWMHGLLAKGYRSILRVTDIPRLESQLEGDALRRAVILSWEQRAGTESILTLPKVLAQCLAAPLISAVGPRLMLIIFRYSQPILISQAVQFIEDDTQSDDASRGYWLILAAIVIYTGQVFSTSLYYRRLNKVEVMMRGSLISLIYNKVLNISSNVSDAARVVTIMSTDVNETATAGQLLHETWAKLFELIIGVILLAREVNWLWPLPFVIIFFCSRVSAYVARNIRSKQKNWNLATQQRISALSAIIGSMKSVKALGLSGAMTDYVNRLRQNEIDRSKDVRWMNVAYNASANALGIFAPAITIVLFAVIARLRHAQLEVSTAFTTVAILVLVTEPANMIMTLIPKAVASSANFERIQAYLLELPRLDKRQVKHYVNGARIDEISIAIQLADVTVESATRTEHTLQNISLSIPQGSIAICSGVVGSGKSVLAKVILGEISPSSGRLAVASSCIGFCDQQAWIPTGNVQQIICGLSMGFDRKRYEDAIDACCLRHDLNGFPDGDRTVIGSRGINLSGGQRQRLALARLVYTLQDIVVLDDPFSALDGNTENAIVENLLGPNGWFRSRGTTVFLVTNSTQHFHIADRIILLEQGQISSNNAPGKMKMLTTEMGKFTFQQEPSTESTRTTTIDPQRIKAQLNNDAEEDLYRKTGEFSLYSYYLRSAGVLNALLVLSSAASYSFFISFPQYWLKWWTESDDKNSNYYICGYILLALAAWVTTNGIMWSTLLLLAPRSGTNLHRSLLGTIFGAPLLFFSTTDTGIILNRFSQDISLVDRQLPNAFSTLGVQIFKMLVQLVLIIRIQKWLAISLPLCLVVVYFVQRIYLRTSRQLRVLELESQSSLYGWFLETAEGLVTIRSFSWSSAAEERNLRNIDASMRPYYALKCLQRWLNLILNLIVSGIAIGLIAIAVNWKGTTTSGGMGAALNLMLVANTTLVRLVESWASLEVSLGAIARLRNVERYTPREDQNEENMVTESPWPAQGNTQITNLDAGYNTGHNILHGINLDIQAGQKVVICGRTGSGKSTVLLALLRLIESTGGIIVDGQGLHRIPRHIIRERCFITIPQDPFFIPQATLRFNLDPSSMATDGVLKSALDKVGIWTLLSHTANNGVMPSPLDEAFSSLPTLSAGQLQLLAMARAIVRKNVLSASRDGASNSPKPILLLDEATSSLDAATEAAIYDIVEGEFVEAGHTVLIVAHRLGAIAGRMRPGRDVIAWLKEGKIMKIGDYEEITQFATTNDA
ncbi:ABC multidrug transporter B [Cladobotryum mycophilum]|uniref:ABC multidrug transporter B n=1 Tax=Cladobotryum mycophilum TaxID=491253 RepID=A0ABR0STC5_9HYPO